MNKFFALTVLFTATVAVTQVRLTNSDLKMNLGLHTRRPRVNAAQGNH